MNKYFSCQNKHLFREFHLFAQSELTYFFLIFILFVKVITRSVRTILSRTMKICLLGDNRRNTQYSRFKIWRHMVLHVTAYQVLWIESIQTNLTYICYSCHYYDLKMTSFSLPFFLIFIMSIFWLFNYSRHKNRTIERNKQKYAITESGISCHTHTYHLVQGRYTVLIWPFQMYWLIKCFWIEGFCGFSQKLSHVCKKKNISEQI